MEWIGGCLCGTVRYRVEGEPLWICHCHCGMCRKQTGAAFGTYVGFAAAEFRWMAGKPALYRSSVDVKSGFCPNCGGTLTFHRVHETSIAVGSLDRPEALELGAPRPEYPDNHVWTENQLPWLKIDDNLKRFARFPPMRDRELAALSGQEPVPGG